MKNWVFNEIHGERSKILKKIKRLPWKNVFLIHKKTRFLAGFWLVFSLEEDWRIFLKNSAVWVNPFSLGCGFRFHWPFGLKNR